MNDWISKTEDRKKWEKKHKNHNLLQWKVPFKIVTQQVTGYQDKLLN
jgi:hypothetical protein